MTFDDEGKIASMKAYWGQDNITQLIAISAWLVTLSARLFRESRGVVSGHADG